MEVILIESVKNVGKLGDVAKVAGGYARNFLIPYQKAVLATDQNRKIFEKKRAELEAKAQERLQDAQKRSEKFDGIKVTIEALASDEGKLYGSIQILDVVHALARQDLTVNRSEVMLGQTIRDLGTYNCKLQFHPDVIVDLVLDIVAINKPQS